jgi:hypothetical protein
VSDPTGISETKLLGGVIMNVWRRLAVAALLVAGLLGGAGRALAQVGVNTFDAQNWKPALDPYGYVTVEGARSLQFPQPFGAIYFDWARNPVKLVNSRPLGFGRDVIENIEQFDFVAALGLLSIGNHGGLSVGVDVPYAANIDGHTINFDPVTLAPKELPEAAFGDVRAAAKLTVLDREDDVVGLAFKGEIGIPTGRTADFLSDRDRPTFTFGAILEKQWLLFRLGGQVEYQYINQHSEVAGVTYDDKLKIGIAGAFEPFDEKATKGTISFIVEAFHWMRIGNAWKSEAESPIELGGAVKYAGTIFALLGANAGLNAGVGAPDVRVYAAAGVSF